MPENEQKINPLKWIFIKSIFYFIIFEFGSSVTINTFIWIFKYESKFWLLFYYAFYSTLIIYILMIIALYTSRLIFHYLYYLFFVFVAWFYHNTGGFIGLYLLNNIIMTLPYQLNLLIYILFGTGLSLICIYTDNNPKIDRIKLKCENLKGNINIVQLSDLHLGGSYGKESVEMYIKPIYYITGNHEDLTWKDEFINMIENKTNLIHLPNNLVTIDKRINLIGIDYKKNLELIRAQLKNLINKANNDLPNIFIHHIPIFKPDTLPDFNLFLFLCGHTHGGKAFPFTLIKFFLGRWLTIIIEGLYIFKNKYFVYCCAGTGTSGPNSRCFVGANIGFITIEGN